MSQVLLNQKKAKFLEQKRTYLNTLILRLFKNNYTIVSTSTEANLTEVTDSGYAATSPANFAASYLNGSNQGETDAPAWTTTFNHNAGDFTTYGYYFTDPADSKATHGENAASPFTCTAANQTYTVVPKMLDDTM